MGRNNMKELFNYLQFSVNDADNLIIYILIYICLHVHIYNSMRIPIVEMFLRPPYRHNGISYTECDSIFILDQGPDTFPLLQDDHSRVVLKASFGGNKTGFINASYIHVSMKKIYVHGLHFGFSCYCSLITVNLPISHRITTTPLLPCNPGEYGKINSKMLL